MKFFLYLFCILLVFNSCQQHSYKTFVVKGNVKNASYNKIQLLSFGGTNNVIILDTAIIDSKGNYSLKSLSNESELYALKIGKSSEIWLVNDTSEIVVNVDINAFKQYSVKGSRASNDLHNFITVFDSVYNKTQNVNTGTDSLAERNNDSTQISTKNENNGSKKYLKLFFNTSFSATANPALQYFYVFYALNTGIIDVVEACNLLSLASAKKPNHGQLNGLKKTLSERIKSDYKLYLIGDTIPDLNYVDIDSNKISSKSFANKYLIINFWQSKSIDCIKENDRIKKYLGKYQSKNITALNISLDSSNTAWYKAVKRDSLQWKQVRDTMFSSSNLVKFLHISTYPTSVLLSPQKRIISADLRAEKLKEKLLDLFEY